MPAPATLPDPTRCPLCLGANQCGRVTSNEAAQASPQAPHPCWCTTATFPAALLARIAPEARGLACVCAACSHAAQASEAPSNATQ